MEKNYQDALKRAKDFLSKENVSDEAIDAVKRFSEYVFPDFNTENVRKDLVNLIMWVKSDPNVCNEYYYSKCDEMLDYVAKNNLSVWKPSEKQVIALKNAIIEIEDDNLCETLMSLLVDLKKQL